MGVVALLLTNNYIRESVDSKASDIAGKAERQVVELSQQVSAMQQANNENIQKLYAFQQQQMQQMQQMAAAAPKQQEMPTGASLAMITPPGKRAVTISVDVLNAIGGLIQPGDFVDVIAHIDAANEIFAEKGMITLFQNVRVLAVGRNMQSQPVAGLASSGPVAITLALNPNEAGLLTFIYKRATLQLVLRPPLETDAYALPIASWQSLGSYMKTTQGLDLYKEPEKVVPPTVETKKSFDIQVFRGGREQRVK